MSAIESSPPCLLWRLERRSLVSGGLALAAFVAFLAYYGLLCVQPDWGGDFQIYVAGVARLYRDMRDPLHESLNVPGSQSTVYTPFLVGVALLGKLFAVTPYRALQAAGVFNLGLFAFGVCFFCSRVSAHRHWWLSAACLLFTTLCLRWFHVGWSSEMSLTNLQYIQPYPGTFAWALSLISFGLLPDARQKRRWLELVGLMVMLSLLLSSHVLTGSWVAGVVGLYGLWVSVQERSGRPLFWAIVAVCGALVPVVLWPYASFFDQFGNSPLVSSMQTINDGSSFGRSPFTEFPTLYGLALPCFAYLGLRQRRHGFWLLALLGTLAALLLWRQLGMSYGNRYAIFATFFPQFIVAETMVLGIFALLGPLPELPSPRRWARWDRPLLIVLLVLACTAWLPSPMRATAQQTKDYGTLWSPAAVLRRPSAHDAYYRQFSDVAHYVSPVDVVIMPVSRAVLDFASITGASVVGTPLAMRVPDANARFRAVARFFHPKTQPEARRDIARQYGATKILALRREQGLIPALTQTFGEPVYRDETQALFEVVEN
jgi:hypothetical protein